VHYAGWTKNLREDLHMKITRVEAIHLRLPEVAAVADGTQESLLVRIDTDAGVSGWGEIVSCSYVAKAVIDAPRSAPFRHGLAAVLIGRDPGDIDELNKLLRETTAWYGPGGVVGHAISGVDQAMWDIRGKAAGEPVRRLLMPDSPDEVDCYASVLWPDTPVEVEASCNMFIEGGYRAVKYGWGPMGADPGLDEELVSTARHTLGDDIDLMIDAGRAWDATTALARARTFERYRPRWLEEPLLPDDFVGYCKLAADSPVPVAAGEVLTLPEEFARLTDTGVAFVQPDLGRAGGVSGVHNLARCAPDNVDIVPHAYGTGILLAASAQFAATQPGHLTEYTRSTSPLARDLIDVDLKFCDGQLRLGDSPGLGITVNEDVVRRFRYRE
jgi:L-rhamnonate dehydratase